VRTEPHILGILARIAEEKWIGKLVWECQPRTRVFRIEDTSNLHVARS